MSLSLLRKAAAFPQPIPSLAPTSARSAALSALPVRPAAMRSSMVKSDPSPSLPTAESALLIASGEAFKNVCCHGADGWSCCVEVKCSSDESKMTVTIEDKAKIHDLPKDKKPCLDCPKEGDLGVQMIRKRKKRK